MNIHIDSLSHTHTHTLTLSLSLSLPLQVDVIDEIPPPKRWELPRTPVRVVEQIQLQLSPVQTDNSCGLTASRKRTPVRVEPPVHPLARSSKATPTRLIGICRDGDGRSDSKTTAQSTEEEQLPLREDCSHNELKSPPISVSKGTSLLLHYLAL